MLSGLATTAACPPWIVRVDPRLRVVVAVVFALVVALATRSWGAAVALGAGLLAVAAARLPVGEVRRRLVPLNVVMLLLGVFVPLATRGESLLAIGPWSFSREGLALAGLIALKANAIVLVVLALVGTMETATLGHALAHLYVPEKVVHLLLLTVRYVGVLQRESQRLRIAMKARGFRPRMNGHTYRSYGQLVGMLLVRSLDRAERILAAMKCRGFRGHFYLLDHFAYSTARDLSFAAIALATLLVVAGMEWL